MRNHEVTTVQPLLKADGTLREPGWSRSMVQVYDRSKIKAPAFRIKEWDYYLVVSQRNEFAVALTISDDGNEFTSVYECAVPELPSKGEASVCTLDKTYTARYVRIYAYKLRDQKGFNDGHIFQVSEVEIYNK